MKDKNTKNDIKRYLSNLYTKEEAKNALANFRDISKEEKFHENAEKLWAESESYQDTTIQQKNTYVKEASDLLKKINKKKRSKPRYLKSIIYIAASIVILIGVGITIFESNTISVDPSLVTVSTSFGERKTLTLPDGTIVNLNACSQIDYPSSFKGDKRSIKLIGEAYFDVSPNDKKPFIVTTEHFDITVLGTRFDVKAYTYDKMLSVSVESGKVQVDMPEAMTRLTKNEQILIDTESNEYSKKTDIQTIAVWRDGNLCFDATPIRDVAKELERIYNYKIKFAPNQTFENLISGEHTNRSLHHILKSIEYTSGIHYKFDTDKKEIIFFK